MRIRFDAPKLDLFRLKNATSNRRACVILQRRFLSARRLRRSSGTHSMVGACVKRERLKKGGCFPRRTSYISIIEFRPNEPACSFLRARPRDFLS
jgi:hypothetical protein